MGVPWKGWLEGVPQRDFRPANLLFKVFWPVFPFGHGPFWVWSLLGIVPFGHGPFWVRSLLGMVPFGAWSLLAGPFWPVPFGRSLMAWSLMTSNEGQANSHIKATGRTLSVGFIFSWIRLYYWCPESFLCGGLLRRHSWSYGAPLVFRCLWRARTMSPQSVVS